MEANLFRYIWRHSKAEQLTILSMVVVSLPFYFLSLDLPKQIVNQGIQGHGFEGPGDTQSFLVIHLPFGEALTGEAVLLFEGFTLEQPGLLLALSFAFLGLVIVNGLFKFVINTQKGRLGERMLRRLRFELTDRLLRFQLPHLRRVKQAEAATMVKDEVEPLGGFIGDAFITPAFLGGQALTAMAFILVQSIWLGLVAAAIVLVQAFLIPRLRRRILELGRQRQLTARQLAGRVGEVVDGAIEIHANDTSNFERADIASRLGAIFHIRFEIYQRKFFVKFLNNLLAQLTPFFFYSVGGLLALSGRLDIGALVAVIAAYKDLPGPIKELIDWDQQRNDVQIKYEQVIDQFQPGELLDPALQPAEDAEVEPLTGEIVGTAVTLLEDHEAKLLDSVSFRIPVEQRTALVGDGASGKEHLALLVAGLLRPSSGAVRIGDRDLTMLPESVTGRRMGYVGPDAYLFPLSVYDNLVYSLKHRPLREHEPPDERAAALRARELDERRRSGNIPLDVEADWIDYQAAGASGSEDLTQRIVELLCLVEIEDDVYRFGLAGTVDPERRPELVAGVMRARAALPERLAREDAEDLVFRFDPEHYNRNASLAVNLLFGQARKPAYHSDNLASNALLMELIEEMGLLPGLLERGLTIARTMVEIFADLPPGHPFFEQFSFIDADDLPDFRALVQKADKIGLDALGEQDRRRLLGLPFKYVEARHRLDLIDDEVERKVVEVRKRFAERVAEADPEAIEFYDPDRYNSAASLQDNILFGRVAYGRAEAQEVVGRAVTEVLSELGLREAVIEVGLDHNVGVGGRRLSGVQRQKLALARALLKRPDLLIVNEALTVVDQATQARLMEKILTRPDRSGVLWTLGRPPQGELFDYAVVMRAGRVVEQGPFAELAKPGSALSDLIAAE